MRVNKVILLSVFLLVIFSVLATSSLAESDIEITVKNNHIAFSERAQFNLKITNNADEKQRYSIYSLQSGQGWNVDPFPLKDKIIELYPGKSYTTIIQAQAFDDGLQPGIYYVQISIASDLGETYTESLKVYLSPEKPIDYLPAIKATIDMNDKISPKDGVSIKLFLENRNPLDLTGLVVKIQSDMPEFIKEATIDLPPLEKKTIEFSINPNQFQQPKEYIIFFVFEHNGEVAKIIDQKIEILSLQPEFKKEVNENSKLFRYYNELIVTNDGNVKNTQKVLYPISLWKVLFTTSEGKSEKIEGERYLVWEQSISPNESVTLNFTTNYRVVIYILAILLIFAGFYFYVQSPLSISKSAMTTKTEHNEGALSEIKVTLEVKNRTKRNIKGIDIIDQVPGIANVEKSLELGTLRPKEIKHSKKGTKVIWSLVELDAHEHRIITYKVRAKLNIVGTFSLPRATVEYARKRGKKGKAYSNVFNIST